MTWRDDGITTSVFLDHQRDVPGNRPDDTSKPEKPFPRNVIAATGQLALRTRLLFGCVGFVLGAIVCLLLAIVEFAAWVLIAPPRSIVTGKFPTRVPNTFQPECVGEPIEVRAADGARLAGRWLPAPGAAPTGRTAILLHGFAEASSVLEAQRAAALNRHGWNVAVLDSRGYGQSGGPFATFGGREAGDIHTWLEFLEDRVGRIDSALPFQAVLWGRSMGAGIALRAAAAQPRLTAIVLESPMVDLKVSMHLSLGRRRIPLPMLMARLATRRASKIAGVSIHSPRPIDSAEQVTCPTLILHGTNDIVVTIAEARRLAAAFPTSPHWIEVIDARHTDVVDKGGDELLDRIAEFLDETANAGLAAQASARITIKCGAMRAIAAQSSNSSSDPSTP